MTDNAQVIDMARAKKLLALLAAHIERLDGQRVHREVTNNSAAQKEHNARLAQINRDLMYAEFVTRDLGLEFEAQSFIMRGYTLNERSTDRRSVTS